MENEKRKKRKKNIYMLTTHKLIMAMRWDVALIRRMVTVQREIDKENDFLNTDLIWKKKRNENENPRKKRQWLIFQDSERTSIL